jgi:copper transport protein
MVSNILLVLLGWIHIVAVTAWGGGAIFLTFILTPQLAKLPPKDAASLGGEVSKQFTKLGYLSIILIALTGLLRMSLTKTLNLDTLLNSSYGQILLLKILLFLVMIILITQIVSTGAKLGGVSGPQEAMSLQKRIGLLSKTTISLGIIIILLSVGLRHRLF